MKVYNIRPIAVLLIKILIFFQPFSSVHLFQNNQRFQATPFGKALNLTFPKLSSQNMRGFDLVTILSNSFHGLCKERLVQCPPPTHLCIKYDEKSGGYFQKNWVGVCGTLPETLTLLVRQKSVISPPPYPISDLIKNLIPYLRPEDLELGP